MDDKINQLAKDSQDWVISLRRHFHMWPELGGEEWETQRRIIEEFVHLVLNPARRRELE
jgi:amidohydrolase